VSEQKRPAPGAWCHIEIGAKDPQAAKKFYGECFGWQFTEVPQMNYILYQTGEGGIGGGIMPQGDYPQQMINYVYVDDVDAAAQRVTNNGGKVIKERTEVPQTGWFAIVADPDGNTFGLWQGMGGG
jgi:predicted enzyme related to lactoylglutathione lyase